MAFKKGNSGNAKGRKKGTPNKVTQLQREFIQTLLDTQQDKIKLELNGLHGKDYLGAINGLMEFVIPKFQRTELTTTIINNNQSLLNTDPFSNNGPMIIKIYESQIGLEIRENE